MSKWKSFSEKLPPLETPILVARKNEPGLYPAIYRFISEEDKFGIEEFFLLLPFSGCTDDPIDRVYRKVPEVAEYRRFMCGDTLKKEKIVVRPEYAQAQYEDDGYWRLNSHLEGLRSDRSEDLLWRPMPKHPGGLVHDDPRGD